jgi:hypothetical protein
MPFSCFSLVSLDPVVVCSEDADVGVFPPLHPTLKFVVAASKLLHCKLQQLSPRNVKITFPLYFAQKIEIH